MSDRSQGTPLCCSTPFSYVATTQSGHIIIIIIIIIISIFVYYCFLYRALLAVLALPSLHGMFYVFLFVFMILQRTVVVAGDPAAREVNPSGAHPMPRQTRPRTDKHLHRFRAGNLLPPPLLVKQAMPLFFCYFSDGAPCIWTGQRVGVGVRARCRADRRAAVADRIATPDHEGGASGCAIRVPDVDWQCMSRTCEALRGGSTMEWRLLERAAHHRHLTPPSDTPHLTSPSDTPHSDTPHLTQLGHSV